MTTNDPRNAVIDQYTRRRLAELVIAELEATSPSGQCFADLAAIVRGLLDPARNASELWATWRAVASEPFRARGEDVLAEAITVAQRAYQEAAARQAAELWREAEAARKAQADA